MLRVTYRFVLFCFFFLRAADWPITDFLGMYCYFAVIRLVNFVEVAPVTVVTLREEQFMLSIFVNPLNLIVLSF